MGYISNKSVWFTKRSFLPCVTTPGKTGGEILIEKGGQNASPTIFKYILALSFEPCQLGQKSKDLHLSHSTHHTGKSRKGVGCLS